MPRSPSSVASAPPAEEAPTDASLVAAARAGARWAQEALFLRHVRLVGGLVFRVHRSRVDLDDLVQDTFVAAFESLESLRNPQAFAAWVGSLAIRITHKRLRRRRIAARLGLGASAEEVAWDEMIAPTCPPDVAVELGEACAILASFPSHERRAFLLRKVEGLSLEEIAAATSTSLSTAKRRIAAAEDRLADRASAAPPLTDRASAPAQTPLPP
jgi:RNA polymerase sigma-70 factor (ECF subfamily)